MTDTRYRVEYDEFPDLSWLEQWDTPEKYEGNEILEDGSPVPFEQYAATWGDPDRHVVLALLCEEKCPHCSTWDVIDSLGGIDYLDWLDYPATGVYESPEDCDDEHMRSLMRDMAAERAVAS